jgi:zinc D-Ala-D-Ala carboxypeptidase
MDNISKHITYREATFSQTATNRGFDNTPEDSELENMQLVAEKIFEPCREFVGGPLFIHSFYRSLEVNAVIGGARYSQHCKGEAIDMDCQIFGGKTNVELFEFILNNLDFDQIIWESGTDEEPDWVHVSYKKSGNRHKVTKMEIVNGQKIYKDIKI